MSASAPRKQTLSSGGYALITEPKDARAATTLPVLCKDFMYDPYQVFEARQGSRLR